MEIVSNLEWFIKEAEEVLGCGLYANPADASGNCLISVSRLLESCPDWSDHLNVIYMETFKPFAPTTYTNHYALLIEGKVVDFTLRQFNPRVPYPSVMDPDDWRSVLIEAWDDHMAVMVYANDVCQECYKGVSSYCQCHWLKDSIIAA